MHKKFGGGYPAGVRNAIKKKKVGGRRGPFRGEGFRVDVKVKLKSNFIQY